MGDFYILRGHLEPGAIIQAVEAFTGGRLAGVDGQPIGGQPPAGVGLHPWLLAPQQAPPEFRRRSHGLAGVVAGDIAAVKGRGIEVRGMGGILAGEVALFQAKGCGTLTNYAESRASKGAKFGGGAGTGREALRPGPKPIQLPLERLSEMAAGGMGIDAIAAVLVAEGFRASPRTVARRLAGVKVKRNGNG